MANERFRVQGFGGIPSLVGDISVRGAKNEALKVLASSVLFADDIRVTHAPHIEDMKRMYELLSSIGVSVEHETLSSVRLTPSSQIAHEFPQDVSEKFRASIVLAGPLLARLGRVAFWFPGGCMIGKRPIDFFVDGFEKMGARVRVSSHEKSVQYVIDIPTRKLRGANIFLKAPSVTATETFMMAGILADGVTTIQNAAMEPEIVSLTGFLVASGARIYGVGTPTITVVGTGLLRSGGAEHRVIPDRIEAGSFVVLASLLAKDMTVSGVRHEHMSALYALLEEAGVPLHFEADAVRVTLPEERRVPYKSFSIKTQGYPGFPTDLQAPITLFLTQCAGEGSVFETIFESRLAYIEHLNRMGASIRATQNQAFVAGPRELVGSELDCTDLRAGMAFVIASLFAKGESTLTNIYNVDRGYESIESRLQNIGAQIVRESC